MTNPGCVEVHDFLLIGNSQHFNTPAIYYKMNFAKWFTEMDQQQTLPDPRQFIYIACLLDESVQDDLKKYAAKWISDNSGRTIPPNWIWKAHHMTVLFRGSGLVQKDMETYRNLWGEEITLTVTGIAFDLDKQKIAAVTVKPSQSFPMQNVIPHITIAHEPSVGAKESNTLLMNHDLIHKVNPVQLRSTFSALNDRRGLIWPPKSFNQAAVSHNT